jgi:hypothetical protein
VHHSQDVPVAPVPMTRAPARPANHYDQLSLMNLTVNDFKSIRKATVFNPDTNQDEVIISFVDAVRGFYAMVGRSINNNRAAEKLRSINSPDGPDDGPLGGRSDWSDLQYFKFSGPGQRETPAGTLQQFLEIAARLPGLPFDRLRKEQAYLAARVAFGDQELVGTILDRSDVHNGTTTIATVTSVKDGEASKEQVRGVHKRLASDHADMVCGDRPPHKKVMLSTVKESKDDTVLVETRFAAEAVDLAMGNAHVDDSRADCDAKSVYFIRIKDTTMVKVGYAGDVTRRLVNLQVACPLQLEVMFQIQTPRAEEYERKFHQALAASRVRGEWFDLPTNFDYAAFVLEQIAES